MYSLWSEKYRDFLYMACGLLITLILLYPVASFAVDSATNDSGGNRNNTADTVTAKQESINNDNLRLYDLDLIVNVTARRDETIFRSPCIAHSLNSQAIRIREMSRYLPDALKNYPSIMVQKTSYGQGSPYIRGFTGYYTLFMIDGVRLNNSVFREGPNQYSATIDPFSISRVEIAKGPGSALYGSDAVGGIVNIVTNNSTPVTGKSPLHSGLYYRYSSADNSNVGRVDLNGRISDKIGYQAGFSRKQYGDLRSGGGIKYRKTGYNELDYDLSAQYLISSNSKLELVHQRDNQDDVWRASRTIYGVSWDGTTIGTDKRLSYDQKRDLTCLRFSQNKQNGFFRNLNGQLSYHIQKEDEFRIKSNSSNARQGFQVNTTGLSLIAESNNRLGTFTYGIDSYYDKVDSYQRSYKSNGSLDKIGIQGPVADNSHYLQAECFVQNSVAIKNRLNIISTVRGTTIDTRAGRAINPLSGGSILTINKDWNHFTASLRSLLYLDNNDRWNLFGSVGSAFRAPNLSDLSRFDIARTNELEIPSPDLKPENFICYELGIKHQSDRMSLQFAGYYTSISNMIIRTPLGITIDSLNAVMKKNSGHGRVYGVEISCQQSFGHSFFVYAAGTFSKGDLETYPTSAPILVRETLNRMMPPTANVGAKWESVGGGNWIEMIYSGATAQRNLSTADKADTQRIPPNGTPGYGILTLRGGMRITQPLVISAALENITDRAYRIHGSGQNEPGRNLVIAVELAF